MKYIIALLFLLMTGAAFAQRQEKPLVQFSGIIHNADTSGVIVPYVSITNKSFRKQVNTSNYEGYFSFVAHEKDTLVFTCVGYAPVTIVIPSNLPNKSYTRQVMIKPQIINLPVFRVFPWATTEEFTTDFLTMKLADDELEIARKNLNVTTLMTEAHNLKRDGSEPINATEMHNELLNSHSVVNPLLNPFAWGALIRQISDGDKTRENSTGNSNSSFISN
jgi:hypothetical protein